jgi:hypothetical protein
MVASEGNFQRTARVYLAAIDKYNGKTNAHPDQARGAGDGTGGQGGRS